jgi:hypothetical protein
MIDLVDRALATIVKRHALNGSSVAVSFDAPTKSWAGRQNSPVLNLYLYDIREDLERREVAYEQTRNEEGQVVARRAPPRRFTLSYLITAWTQRAEDEHRILSSTLEAFLRFESIPADALEGPLSETRYPIHMRIAMPPADERSISDLWTALGGELKPSLDLVLAMPFEVDRSAEVGPPIVEEPRVKVVDMDSDGGPEHHPASPGRRKRVPKPKEPRIVEEELTGGTKESPGRTVRARALPQRWDR